MTTKHPQGIICPVATPLLEDESLDSPAFRRLLDRIVPHIDGLLVLGTTGEFAFLRESTAREAVAVAVEQVNGRIPIYVGVGDTGTARVLSKIEQLAIPGVDFTLVCSPFYYAVSDEQALAKHFRAAADASPIPMLVYNIPQNTHNNLSSQLVSRLANHPNIVGLKDSWGDMFQFQEFLNLRSPDFRVFQGPEHLAAASLWLGADGVVSALANIHPRPLRELVEYVHSGQRDRALATQRKITRLAGIFQFGNVSSVLKAALHELGIGNGRPAAPLPPCTEEQISSIRKVLKQAEIIPQEETHG